MTPTPTCLLLIGKLSCQADARKVWGRFLYSSSKLSNTQRLRSWPSFEAVHLAVGIQLAELGHRGIEQPWHLKRQQNSTMPR